MVFLATNSADCVVSASQSINLGYDLQFILYQYLQTPDLASGSLSSYRASGKAF
jgi:hypothetical protein